MGTEQNKANVRRFYQEVLNEQRLERADEYVAQDYLDHGALPGQGPGLEGAKHRWATYFAAIPDMHATIEDMVAEGDRVTVRWIAEGTHRGTLMGIPPTGKHIRVGGISIYRLVDGRQAEQWEQADTLGLMQQLGVIPSPEARETRAA